MPVCEATILCVKCGAESSIKILRARNSYCCEHCGEPIRALIELDKATWDEGDFNNEPPQEGKEAQ
jgi:hypothetical protein